MSTPSIPPRPPQRAQAAHSTVKNDLPLVPPRPTRNVDPSPDRAARSPLNDPSTAWGHPKARSRISQDLPRRPPSVVALGNDIGHEGDEYSSFDQLPDEARSSAPNEQTRNVSADLPIHQPKASVPQSTAKRQIQGVTGTDSTQAAAAGIGRSKPADDVHKPSPADAASTASPLASVTTGGEPRRAPSTEPYNVLRTKSSFNRSTSSLQPLERSSSRPASIHGDDREHGIPEIGRQVPLLHMAGDVQAPSPAAGSTQHMPGIGFFNDGSTRNHVRRRSSRQEFGPPDAYGMHHDHQDQFEKEWARKHPQEAAKEGYYTQHLPKPVSALTDEQLNRLVHQSDDASTARALGTPDEQYADNYISRVSSAAPSPAPEQRAHPTVAEQHLRPSDALASTDPQASPRRGSNRGLHDEEHEHAHADGTPILASDELLKRPSSSYMHAAVTPDPDSHYDEHYDSDTGRRNSTQATSRPSSRPSSVHGTAGLQSYHGGSLHRFISHEEPHHSGAGTPLEEIEEYEPLFPEDEKEVQKRIFKKRPELAQHHFPSHDVWEDTPSSLQYSTTVSTPEVEETQQARGLPGGGTTFETPEQEAQRRVQNDKANNMTSENKTFLKPQFKSSVAADMHRPGTHRFPSSDVWEDSPDSFTLVNQTTLSGSEADEQQADIERPAIPARPQRPTKLATETKPTEDAVQRDVTSPPIPAKPSIPARPARPARQDQLDGAEAAEASQPKAPFVSGRAGGEKIASLKAGFMTDLNNRLKHGPQGPPKKEAEPEAEEESKAPLADARKLRAKGPARRKPAAAPSSDRRSSAAFAFSPLIHCWSIDEEDELQVHPEQEPGHAADTRAEVEKMLAENGEKNTESAAQAGEIATQISKADKPEEMARKHRGSETELKAALAVAGAAPPSYGEEAAEEGGVVVNQS